MIARHERIAAIVDEPRALAAERLGDEEAGRARTLERGRMKLDELQIGQARAGVIRERDPVAGGHRRIRRFAEDLSGAARGQQRRVRAKLLARPGWIEERDADDAPVLHEQLGDERVIDRVDRRQPADALPERAPDFAARRVAGMQHAPHAVRRFAPERGLSARVALERAPPSR